MKLPCLSLFCQKLIANSQKRLLLSFSPAPQLLCSLALLFFCQPAFSQQRWTKTYGGTGDDGGGSVQQTTDGGYILVGMTSSFGSGNFDVYLIKIDASGDTLWTKTYGGPNYDAGSSVRQTMDGGYVVVGVTSLGAMGENTYLIKTNASGDSLWSKTYRGSFWESGASVQQTSDGGYIIAGSTNTFVGIDGVILTRTDASGDTLWRRTYGGTGDDWGSAVQQTSDGGFIISGTTFSFGDTSGDVYLIKTNVSGDTLWTKTYGGTKAERGSFVQQTTDGGYIIVGSTFSYGAGLDDVYLIKTNASGDTLWTRTYGGANYDWGSSVQQTTDGGYIVAGETWSYGADLGDVYLIKTNASGDTLWTKTYGGTGDDGGASVQQTSDGGYILAGFTSSFGAGNGDIYLIKTDVNGNVGVENKALSSPLSRLPFSVRPNPFISFARIPGHESESFALYDIAGRKVGTYKGEKIGEGLAAGIYFLKPKGEEAKLLRVVKLR